jgi:hypothetical protein
MPGLRAEFRVELRRSAQNARCECLVSREAGRREKVVCTSSEVAFQRSAAEESMKEAYNNGVASTAVEFACSEGVNDCVGVGMGT